MAVANTIAYYNTATIAAVKSFVVMDPADFLFIFLSQLVCADESSSSCSCVHLQSEVVDAGKKVKISLTFSMEQRALKSVNNCLNTNIYSYLETSGGQSSNLCLNVVHVFNTSVN
jgi:hypothetical protein